MVMENSCSSQSISLRLNTCTWLKWKYPELLSEWKTWGCCALIQRCAIKWHRRIKQKGAFIINHRAASSLWLLGMICSRILYMYEWDGLMMTSDLCAPCEAVYTAALNASHCNTSTYLEYWKHTFTPTWKYTYTYMPGNISTAIK